MAVLFFFFFFVIFTLPLLKASATLCLTRNPVTKLELLFLIHHIMPTATHSTIPLGFLLSQKPVILWIHDPGAMYNHDAVVNPEIFTNFRDGQLLRIHCPRNNNTQPQQSQNASNDQQDQKKQNEHQGQQNQTQTQQQPQTQKSEQSKSNQTEDHYNEQLDSVIIKGHAVDKESLAKQQQLQVSLFYTVLDLLI
jgi:hypothetical protein